MSTCSESICLNLICTQRSFLSNLKMTLNLYVISFTWHAAELEVYINKLAEKIETNKSIFWL